MLNVFLCEDNVEQKSRLMDMINQVIIIEDFDMELKLGTDNPYELLEYLESNPCNGLYFLDIDLKSNINGIELANKIREIDPMGFIVFITTHSEMTYLTFLYKVEAMDFIIKDNFSMVHSKMQQCIIAAHEKYSSQAFQSTKIFSMKVADRIINIEFSKILYFETSPTIHKIVVHAIDRQVEFYAQMKDIESKLDNRFYRCHRSFIINRDNITEIDIKNRLIHMINGQRCLMSIRLMKGLLN